MGRKTQELEDLRQETIQAQESRSRANQTRALLEDQRGWVESIVSTVSDRRKRNGFGGEYSISTTPRKKAS